MIINSQKIISVGRMNYNSIKQTENCNSFLNIKYLTSLQTIWLPTYTYAGLKVLDHCSIAYSLVAWKISIGTHPCKTLIHTDTNIINLKLPI